MVGSRKIVAIIIKNSGLSPLFLIIELTEIKKLSKLVGMKLISKLLITALALLIAAYFVPGIVIENIYIAMIVAVLLGLLNLIVRPVLVILTLPITIVTLGLFIFIINASIFWFVASFVDGFSVSSFWVALLGSVIVTVISTIGNKFIT